MSLPQQANSPLRRSGAVGLALLSRLALAAFLAVPFNREKDGAYLAEFSLLGSVVVTKIISIPLDLTGSHPLISPFTVI